MTTSHYYYPNTDERSSKDVSINSDCPVHLEKRSTRDENVAVIHASTTPEPKTNTIRRQNSQRRVSLHLSNSLHQSAKRAALEEDETLNSLMVRLLREFIDQRDRTKNHRRWVPSVRCDAWRNQKNLDHHSHRSTSPTQAIRSWWRHHNYSINPGLNCGTPCQN